MTTKRHWYAALFVAVAVFVAVVLVAHGEQPRAADLDRDGKRAKPCAESSDGWKEISDGWEKNSMRWERTADKWERLYDDCRRGRP